MIRNKVTRVALFSVIVLGAISALNTAAQAQLLVYDPFDYPAGDRLGGGSLDNSLLGKTAPTGQRWIVRSPVGVTGYTAANDTQVTAGNLSYAGLATSTGNSVRYGSSITNGDGLYTNAIALPNAINSGSVYYSMIVRFNGVIATNIRTSYASLNADTANPGTDAGLNAGSASGSLVALPASAWIRNSGDTDYHLGGGKTNTDGIGTSANAASWQAAAATPNQQGNTAGTGQDWATVADDTYFMVMKYTFNTGSASDDTVSLWVNPIASTLGNNAGEAAAGMSGGSYYSAINAFTTANVDVAQIQSFVLIGQALALAGSRRSIDTSLDELRIGLTWADVTPAAVSAGVPGDYNNNGTVDAADYVLWRNGGPLQNEVDAPGTVTAQDYVEWKARFGNTSGSGAGLGAVPEPAALLLLGLAMPALLMRGMRRR